MRVVPRSGVITSFEQINAVVMSCLLNRMICLGWNVIAGRKGEMKSIDTVEGNDTVKLIETKMTKLVQKKRIWKKERKVGKNKPELGNKRCKEERNSLKWMNEIPGRKSCNYLETGVKWEYGGETMKTI